MGRRSKLTPELQKQICDNLELGMTVPDICNLAGIHIATYFNWRNAGEAVRDDIRKLQQQGYVDESPEVREREADPYLGFLEASTYAASRANQTAVAAIKSGQVGGKSTLLRRDRIEETKLRKEVRFEELGIDPHTGKMLQAKVIEEIPYQHIKETVSEIEEHAAPDWRAGMEFLRRREPKFWSGEQTKSEDWRTALLELVRSDEVNYGDLEEQVGSELAMELFQAAGKQVLRLNE